MESRISDGLHPFVMLCLYECIKLDRLNLHSVTEMWVLKTIIPNL